MALGIAARSFSIEATVFSIYVQVTLSIVCFVAFTAMSSVLANASRLKPEIRLAQAISQFDAELSSDQKATLRGYRSQIQDAPPDPSHVMRLTAEIDQRASGIMRGGRCYGPRMTSFLHAVQQFAAIGDVTIGSSQNVIACGVWSLVRMSLLVSVFLTPLRCVSLMSL